MQLHSTEMIGIATAGASLYSAYAKTMMPLRAAAVTANLLAMVYFFSEGLYPIFLLNAALLPLNAVRLYSMRKLTRDIDTAINSNMSAEWLLPYMRPKRFGPGEIMIGRGRTRGNRRNIWKGHLTRRNRSFCPSRHTHDDRALQDPCSNRSHRLRQVQRTLLPEPTVWIPPDPLGCCTAAR